MPTKILMPALSPTMEEGNLAKWLVKEGDTVESGDVLCEIETDKATMEFEAVDEGVIGKIVVTEGSEGVKVNDLIAVLLEEGESADDIGDLIAPAASTASPAPLETSAPAAPAIPAPAPAASSPAAKGDRVFASPLARRMATQEGLDLSALSGSGPRGRIVKADIEAALKAGTGKASPTAAAPAMVAAGPVGGYSEEPHSMMRKTIAKRLTEAKQSVPHFYLTVDCRIDDLLAARKQINAQGEAMGIKVSVNDMVIKAVALALKAVPAANASWTDEAIRLYNDVDISMAVATPKGLITPIIRNADQKGLAAIASDAKDLAGRARDGKLKPEEYQGGGFSVSNLGMFGVREFSAIINPPQSCILAVGAGEQRAIVVDGQLAVGTVMSCTLSVDHRSVDGAVGAEFLQAFKGFIENPMSMLL